MFKYVLYLLAIMIAVGLAVGGIHLYRVTVKNKKEMAAYEGPAAAVERRFGRVLVVYYSLSGHTRDGSRTTIHVVVGAYGYPVYLLLIEGQRNDINMEISLLEQISLNSSQILSAQGYHSNQLIDYIYDHGGKPNIPSRKGAKFERHGDWWLDKERHLVEFFLKLKAY